MYNKAPPCYCTSNHLRIFLQEAYGVYIKVLHGSQACTFPVSTGLRQILRDYVSRREIRTWSCTGV